MTAALAKGRIFEHRHFLDVSALPENKPLRCKITKIAQDVVYYRPFYGLHDDGSEWLGAPAYFPLMAASRYIRALT